jgi:hypothetical protein
MGINEILFKFSCSTCNIVADQAFIRVMLFSIILLGDLCINLEFIAILTEERDLKS